MGYWECSLIVEGVLMEVLETGSEATMIAYVNDCESNAMENGQPTELYILRHEHDPDQGDCVCAQYLQSHKPAHAWNQKEE